MIKTNMNSENPKTDSKLVASRGFVDLSTLGFF